MEAEIINILSFRYEKHCANVGGLANATLRHYSESSKYSRNSLKGWLSCSMLRLKTLANVGGGGKCLLTSCERVIQKKTLNPFDVSTIRLDALLQYNNSFLPKTLI